MPTLILLKHYEVALSVHSFVAGSAEGNAPTGGGLRGWSDSEDDGKYQLKAVKGARRSKTKGQQPNVH